MSHKKIEEALEKKGVYVGMTVGVSMYPMLRNKRDTIVVVPPNGRLKKYDVPLYKRGEQYVLHRILEVREDSYVIRGDNCLQKEYGITDKEIIGVLTEFYRNGKKIDMNSIGYRIYTRVWCRIFPIRKICKKILGKLRHIKHRVLS